MDIKKPSSTNKRVSAFIKGNDPNSYRAYKYVTKTESNKSDKSNGFRSKSNDNNMMKFPFGLTAKRFRWQNTNNRGADIELQGNLSKHFLETSTLGKWDNLLKKSSQNILPSKYIITHKYIRSVDKRVQENYNASRTIIPTDIDVNNCILIILDFF